MYVCMHACMHAKVSLSFFFLSLFFRIFWNELDLISYLHLKERGKEGRKEGRKEGILYVRELSDLSIYPSSLLIIRKEGMGSKVGILT